MCSLKYRPMINSEICTLTPKSRPNAAAGCTAKSIFYITILTRVSTVKAEFFVQCHFCDLIKNSGHLDKAGCSSTENLLSWRNFAQNCTKEVVSRFCSLWDSTAVPIISPPVRCGIIENLSTSKILPSVCSFVAAFENSASGVNARVKDVLKQNLLQIERIVPCTAETFLGMRCTAVLMQLLYFYNLSQFVFVNQTPITYAVEKKCQVYNVDFKSAAT